MPTDIDSILITLAPKTTVVYSSMGTVLTRDDAPDALHVVAGYLLEALRTVAR